jgi:hypothetical protein
VVEVAVDMGEDEDEDVDVDMDEEDDEDDWKERASGSAFSALHYATLCLYSSMLCHVPCYADSTMRYL